MTSSGTAVTTAPAAPKIPLSLLETDVIKVVLEFLESRELHIAQIALERETGIINGVFSSDALFLRQLIVDGSWDTALDFVEPLKNLPEFDFKRFRYLILKHKFFELLCIKNEPGCLNNNEFTVDELVECLQSLQPLCPNQDDYNRLCALLTLPKLADDEKLAGWNPSGARIECFNQIFPLVRKFLAEHTSPTQAHSPSCHSSSKDRLLQLLVRGLLYENCMALCQNRAICTKSYSPSNVPFNSTLLTDPPQPLDAELDGSLYSWLKAVPAESFTLPFGRELVDLRVDRLKRPRLEATWTEQILVTPPKPNVFPYNVTPVTRLKSAQKMSLSMLPQYEAFSCRERLASIHEDLSPPACAFSLAPHRHSRFLSQSMVVAAVGFQLSGARRVNRQQQDAIDAMLLERSLIAKPVASDAAVGDGPRVDGASDADATLAAVANSMSQSGDATPLARSSGAGGVFEQRNVAVVAPSSHQRRRERRQRQRRDDSLTPMERDDAQDGDLIDDNGDESTDAEDELPHNMPATKSAENTVRVQDNAITAHRRPLTARQQLEDITRKTSSDVDKSAHTLETRNNASNLPNNCSLYEQFNKNRSVPPRTTTNENMIDTDAAYQMMKMSLYSMSPLPKNSMDAQQSIVKTYMQSNGSMTRQPETRTRFHDDPASTSQLVDNGTIERRRSSTHQQRHEIGEEQENKPVKFLPICRLEDQQAIRTSAFHPSGKLFAVGTNSRQLHICLYPEVKAVRFEHVCRPVDIQLTRAKQHKGSIYSVAFNPTGELLATGSNDKTIKLMQFDSEKCKIGAEFELNHHDGTIRDIIFMEDTSNSTSLLISGGAGNCRINVVDCATGTRLTMLQGHTAPILGLYTWGGCMFVSCSQDKTTQFWDLRCQQAVHVISPDEKTSNAPVTSVCVDVTGRLLVSGHEDASIMLYDIQGSRALQRFHAHADQVRTVRFSPGNYYLLSGSYDKKIVITDMRGDLMGNLQYLPVAQHDDKIVQCRWHPHDFTFLSTSADRTTVLWALPTVPNSTE